jgi:nitroimidazol reductase NimA-like FMN-containing flavoprotein (pyridoxamine 5'-phosphate oxidase superfamily)
MPGYGVETPAWSPLPWPWAAERLVANRNFWVVTVSGDGRPHALPVWGVWDEDERRFAFSSSPRARKVRNLAANPGVVIMTESTVECLSVEGQARLVDHEARREEWIARYLSKYRLLSDGLTADFLRAHVMVEFVPERAFAIIESEEEFSTRATRWVFER